MRIRWLENLDADEPSATSYQPLFGNHRVNEALFGYLKKLGRPIVVSYLGATFNDFTEDQMRWQLRFFHDKFPPGTVFFISIDNTCDTLCLKGAYDGPINRQLAINTVVHNFRKRGYKCDPGMIECNVAAEEEFKNGQLACVAVRKKISIDDGTHRLERSFDDIRKIAEAPTERMIKEEGFETVRIPVPENCRVPGSNHAIYALTHKGARRPPVLEKLARQLALAA